MVSETAAYNEGDLSRFLSEIEYCTKQSTWFEGLNVTLKFNVSMLVATEIHHNDIFHEVKAGIYLSGRFKLHADAKRRREA